MTAIIASQLGRSLFLAEVSSRDSKWDNHKRSCLSLAQIFSKIELDRYAERLTNCASRLLFNQTTNTQGEIQLKLRSADFCRVRLCPICQSRRSLMWQARFLEVLPCLLDDHPKSAFLFLTLTVRNCQVGELRETLSKMNAAWGRITHRDCWRVQGWVKSVEITRNEQTQTAHPHFHAMLMVPPSYFKGENYLSHARWVELWRSCLRVDYDPIVNIKVIRPKNPLPPSATPGGLEDSRIVPLRGAIAETLKYTVKPAELAIGGEWVEEFVRQVHKTRAVSTGGYFKQYLAQLENDSTEGDLIHVEQPEEIEEIDFEQAAETLSLFCFNPLGRRYTQAP